MEEKLSSLKQSGDDPGAERPDDTGRTLCETDFDSIISSTFDLPEHDWSQYSPLTLAWLGDTVFDLLVRTQIVKKANMSPDRLHRKATAVVNARNQARIAEEISPLLTEEEAAVMRRGRNSSPGHSAKNAERREYLEATGLEALIGYLYLKKRYGRITELLRNAL